MHMTMYTIANGNPRFLKWRRSIYVSADHNKVMKMQQWCLEQFYDQTRRREEQPFEFGTAGNFYFEDPAHAEWFLLKWR